MKLILVTFPSLRKEHDVCKRRCKLISILHFSENVAVMSICGMPFNILSRNISTSTISNQIIKLTRLRVVDNSEIGKQAMLEGKPPRCIHIYNKKGVGYIGKSVM